jgi:hypothetical protein
MSGSGDFTIVWAAWQFSVKCLRYAACHASVHGDSAGGTTKFVTWLAELKIQLT